MSQVLSQNAALGRNCTRPSPASKILTAKHYRLRCRAAAELVAKNGTAEAAKRRIEQLAGPKHGTDKSPEEKKAIAEVVGQLAGLKRIDQNDLTGTRWKLVYTESTASSSGKVGPFVGRTEQEFPADKPGQYINWLYLGPVSASLLADYKQAAPDRIDVSFVHLEAKAGPFNFKKDFNNKGTWNSIYIDQDFRAFRTNHKNVFVLKKM